MSDRRDHEGVILDAPIPAGSRGRRRAEVEAVLLHSVQATFPLHTPISLIERNNEAGFLL